jgi:hypothetical protein
LITDLGDFVFSVKYVNSYWKIVEVYGVNPNMISAILKNAFFQLWCEQIKLNESQIVSVLKMIWLDRERMRFRLIQQVQVLPVLYKSTTMDSGEQCVTVMMLGSCVLYLFTNFEPD